MFASDGFRSSGIERSVYQKVSVIMVFETESPSNFWTEHQLRVYARQRVRAAQQRRQRQVQRRVLWLSLAVFGVGTAAQVARSADPNPAFPVRKTAVITVSSGDTLWSLAQAYGEPGRSTQDTLAQISQLNGKLSGKLRPGQRLLIPQ